MAIMIPIEFNESNCSIAEKEIYFILKSALNDDWTVFHSFSIVSRNKQDKIIDAEIDFLVFNPVYGILILEVKGGVIKFENGIWYQNNEKLKIGPDQQARLNKYDLSQYLEKYFNTQPPITIGYAICFPNYFGDFNKLPANIQDILITGHHIPHFEKAIINILSQLKANFHYPIDSIMVRTVTKALMPIFESGTSLSDIFGHEERKFIELTDRQSQLLNFITEYKRALIQGCAGSGKTMMAIKKAKEIYSKGLNVLVLCYNKLLSNELNKILEDYKDRITVSTYHDFCLSQLEKYENSLTLQENSDEYWTIEIPNQFLKLQEKYSIKYDAVIVDEGQDFKEEYWISINDLTNAEGYYYIFFDPEQNLFETTMQLPNLGSPFILSENCRNTKMIFQAMKPFSQFEISISDKTPDGMQVKKILEKNSVLRRKKLSQILHELIVDENIKETQIVILGGHSLRNTCIGDDNQIGQFVITEKGDLKEKYIPYYTYMKYKGLESDVVIILDVDFTDKRWSRNSALYTAISRAKHLLYIIYTNNENIIG